MIVSIQILNNEVVTFSRSIRGEHTHETLQNVRPNLGAKTFAHRQLQRAKIEAKNTALCDRAILQRENRRAKRQK